MVTWSGVTSLAAPGTATPSVPTRRRHIARQMQIWTQITTRGIVRTFVPNLVRCTTASTTAKIRTEPT